MFDPLNIFRHVIIFYRSKYVFQILRLWGLQYCNLDSSWTRSLFLLSGTGPGKTGGSNLYPLQLVNFLEKNNTFHQRIPKQADVKVKYHRRERRERLEFGHFLMR
jgi:hypothetical protein